MKALTKEDRVISVLLPHSKCPECLIIWNEAIKLLKNTSIRNFIILATGKPDIDKILLYQPVRNELSKYVSRELRDYYPIIRECKDDVIAEDEALKDLLTKFMNLINYELIIVIIVGLRSPDIYLGIAKAIKSITRFLHGNLIVISLANLGLAMSENAALNNLSRIIDDIKRLNINEEFEFHPYMDIPSLLTLLTYLKLMDSHNLSIKILGKGSSKLCVDRKCIYLNYAGIVFYVKRI